MSKLRKIVAVAAVGVMLGSTVSVLTAGSAGARNFRHCNNVIKLEEKKADRLAEQIANKEARLAEVEAKIADLEAKVAAGKNKQDALDKARERHAALTAELDELRGFQTTLLEEIAYLHELWGC